MLVTSPIIKAPPAFYRPELDILRFGAFLMVFLTHNAGYSLSYLVERHVPRVAAQIIASTVSAGPYGVDLFFALSAYLITELLLREKKATGRLNVPAFYLRRILRIWPLYFTFLFVAAPFRVLNPGHQFDLRYLAAFLLC